MYISVVKCKSLVVTFILYNLLHIRMNQLIQFGKWMAYLLNGDSHHTCTYIQSTYVHTYIQAMGRYICTILTSYFNK